MARHKEYSYDQGKLIPVYFKEQIFTITNSGDTMIFRARLGAGADRIKLSHF